MQRLGGGNLAYSELIKNFKNIRSYMREFYVYGFKSREEYDAKSARSYDNERRRMESWLGDFMSFRQDSGGKHVFLSVDSRNILHNPLYQAFKAKSFTRGDLLLHFYLLDLLAVGERLSVRELTEGISAGYLSGFDSDFQPDESTVRKKLREYEQLGLLTSEKQGRELYYRQNTTSVDLASWQEAAAFFSEAAPLGVIGSYLLDRGTNPADSFGFKHHYMLHVLDSEILYTLLGCMTGQCFAEITVAPQHRGETRQHTVLPLKIFVSTQTGRQYLLAHSQRFRKLVFFRLDFILTAEAGQKAEQYETTVQRCERFMQHLWGVSTGSSRMLDHLEMTVHVGQGEGHIIHRLEREKRCGTVAAVDTQTYRFTADVYDATEMLPWLRTFIGRIVSLTCTKQSVIDTFYADLAAMRALYGGDDHAVP